MSFNDKGESSNYPDYDKPEFLWENVITKDDTKDVVVNIFEARIPDPDIASGYAMTIKVANDGGTEEFSYLKKALEGYLLKRKIMYNHLIREDKKENAIVVLWTCIFVNRLLNALSVQLEIKDAHNWGSLGKEEAQ